MTVIDSNPLFQVQDSSKIQAYMECARSYFYRHVLGWKKEGVSLHLEYGNAWHLAMEELLNQKKPSHPYSVESMEDSLAKFSKHWRDFFSAEDELTFDTRIKKTLANAEAGLEEYIVTYASSDLDWSVLWTEIVGKVDIGTDMYVHFKCDAIIETPLDEVIVVEHKTGTTQNRTWTDQWNQKTQIGTYLHMANCLFPDRNISLIVNGFFPQNPQKLKKDGTPYANDTKTSPFLRVPMKKTPEMMNDWLVTTQHWAREINRNFDILSHSTDSDPVLLAFPKNPEACTKYWGCPYGDYCVAHANPLQHLGELPMGYNIEFWDPRQYEKDAHKVVNV